MTLGEFALWMLPWSGFALIALYAGYVAWQAAVARERAALEPAGSDPLLELVRVNEEIVLAAKAAHATLHATREAVQRGTR